MSARAIAHLTQAECSAIDEFVLSVVSEFGTELLRIILFGSKARGDFSESSDVDLLMVLESASPQDRFTVSKIASQMVLKYNIPIITTTVSVAEYNHLTYGFAQNLAKEGITLWS